MVKKSIPFRFDCPCGNNMVLAKIMTDGNVSDLGFMSLLTANVNMSCPKCGAHLNEASDDFTRTVNA